MRQGHLRPPSCFSAVEEKPGSASSKKDKKSENGDKAKTDPDLVEVKSGGFSKK